VWLSKKNILVIAILIVIGAGIYFYKEYNRKPADISNVVPAASLTAVALVDSYESDEPNANKLYLGKTIQVTGAIAEINNQQDTLVNVLIGDSNSMHKVSCLLDNHYLASVKNYSVRQQITIRGVCTGYLMDVEMNRCVIIEKK
jgi:tRNA_anti-like